MRRPALLLLPLAAALAAVTLPAAAAGPASVAKTDRRLWTESLNSRNSFDKASRASILTYASALKEMYKMADADMKASFKVKSLNRASVDKWLKSEMELALANYQRAARDCSGGDWTCVAPVDNVDALLRQADSWRRSVPPGQQAWHANLSSFTRTYLAEQLRLAALFPTTSSEIDRFGPHEWNGDTLEDRQFLLTFDDGPSPGTNTDDTLAMLAGARKSGIFFVLGENLQNRVNKAGAATVAASYKGQCVASHGWQHQSHARWDHWQDSITHTHQLLNSTFAKGDVLPYFRPPYGQRQAGSASFFHQQGLQVALWNLDSQDWSSQVSADDVSNRMISLMLIKRHGVLLFHDVHGKAKSALPVIFDELGKAVSWRDCQQPVSKS